jgi:hypothetical protein
LLQVSFTSIALRFSGVTCRAISVLIMWQLLRWVGGC